jgi:enoyl-CoA hydratase/carnithine racemase
LTDSDPREAALAFAQEIAESAPRSVTAIRATMRRKLTAEVLTALDEEADAQAALLDTKDFREGVDAAIAKRTPIFTGE